MSAVGSFLTDIETKYQGFEVLETGGESLSLIRNNQIHSSRELQNVLEEYELDNVPGINDWFEEMSKDFLAPQGLPFPFAEALQKVTGMPPSMAIEWLSVNIVDVAALGTETAVMAFFKKNPKIYSACLVLGMAFGLYSDNPLLVAVNGLQYFSKLRQEGRLQHNIWSNTDRFIRTSFALIDRVCTVTFIANTAFCMAGISLSQLSGNLADSLGVGKKLTAAAHLTDAANVADLVDGVANLGLSMLVGKAVGKMVDWLNDDLKKELEEVTAQVDTKIRLRELLRKEAPPETLVPLIELLKEQGKYEPVLND